MHTVTVKEIVECSSKKIKDLLSGIHNEAGWNIDAYHLSGIHQTRINKDNGP